MFFAWICGHADVSNGILVIVVTKIDSSMLHWPICFKFVQCCCKFLNHFQKLATHCSTANIVKESSATGCYTRTIFHATLYHCKWALQIDQCNTTFRNISFLRYCIIVICQRSWCLGSIRQCLPSPWAGSLLAVGFWGCGEPARGLTL